MFVLLKEIEFFCFYHYKPGLNNLVLLSQKWEHTSVRTEEKPFPLNKFTLIYFQLRELLPRTGGTRPILGACGIAFTKPCYKSLTRFSVLTNRQSQIWPSVRSKLRLAVLQPQFFFVTRLLNHLHLDFRRPMRQFRVGSSLAFLGEVLNNTIKGRAFTQRVNEL